jgi:hypothetical protein
MLDTVTGEVVNRTLMHEGKEVREFYSELPRPVLVGIEAIGPMHWPATVAGHRPASIEGIGERRFQKCPFLHNFGAVANCDRVRNVLYRLPR